MMKHQQWLRFLAHMGARGCLGQVVYDLAKTGELDFSVVSADLGIASGFQRFIAEYPFRYLNVGIAEQNMIGVAAGMASTDHPVIATSWASFASYRCADQIRNYLGLMQSNVKVIGMDSGFTLSRFGGCHYAVGDIAMLRAIPGLTILSPCDGVEIYQCVEEALRFQGPVYIRLTGGETLPVINRDDSYQFEIGKSSRLAIGQDVAILSTGAIVYQCLLAAQLLEKQGVSCSLLNIRSLKPIDRNAILELQGHRLIVTVEEHSVLGGLGAAVAEVLAPLASQPPQIMLGISDMIPRAGSYPYLLSTVGLTGQQIAEQIISALGEYI